MSKTTRTELKTKAETYRKLAIKATPGERTALLKKARGYYADLDMTGMVLWCERHMG